MSFTKTQNYLFTKNIHVEYEHFTTHCSKVIGKDQVFNYYTPMLRSHVKKYDDGGKVLSQGISKL